MKLKNQMLTIVLERARMPNKISLKDFHAFYSKLMEKHSELKGLALTYRGGYYGRHYLVQRRMETDAELAKRQIIVDKRLLAKKKEQEKRAIVRKAEMLKDRAEDKKHKMLMEKAKLEKKVEEVKTMVKVLQMAGFKVSPAKVSARG